MATRLRRVDRLTLPDHPHLSEQDECLYFGEYTARKDWRFSETNSLIWNLKKGLDRRDLPEWKYKGEAIKKAAKFLREALPEASLKRATWVPIPPSRMRDDPEYDDRMLQVLHLMTHGLDADVRELVLQRESTVPVHSGDARPTPEELRRLYYLDEDLVAPRPAIVVLVDDVLTTGCHYRAAKATLQERYPELRVIGIFIARRVPEAD